MGIQIPLCEQCDLVPQPKATTIAKGCVCTWPMEAGPKDEIDSQLHHDGPLLTTNWPLIYHYLSMRFACSKGRQRLFQGLPHVCIGHRSVNDAQERSQMAKKNEVTTRLAILVGTLEVAAECRADHSQQRITASTAARPSSDPTKMLTDWAITNLSKQGPTFVHFPTPGMPMALAIMNLMIADTTFSIDTEKFKFAQHPGEVQGCKKVGDDSESLSTSKRSSQATAKFFMAIASSSECIPPLSPSCRLVRRLLRFWSLVRFDCLSYLETA
jgi:hypothetical protein